MKNPLRDLSRPKALGLAGLAAGALTLSAAGAALNVGLLSAHQAPTFAPKTVAKTGEVQPEPTAEAKVVYKDVYEHVSAPSGSVGSSGYAATPANPATPAAPAAPAMAGSHDSTGDTEGSHDSVESSDDSHESDETMDDSTEVDHESQSTNTTTAHHERGTDGGGMDD